ncbi:carboxypeptidase-like regulatory domain-containing protein [Engelhardtia mirabilis]|uniref:Dioxygenase n=1 Tax=Engelhardtia mirabilis TaxID=2528011 RepID=A0A518BDN1_9BACT|nr:Dioxygenase [Planctomycetes bacterium Pla133]QDU99388.1 Dioxygenase [Planctomycetes bacterium Pla86]
MGKWLVGLAGLALLVVVGWLLFSDSDHALDAALDQRVETADAQAAQTVRAAQSPAGEDRRIEAIEAQPLPGDVAGPASGEPAGEGVSVLVVDVRGHPVPEVPVDMHGLGEFAASDVDGLVIFAGAPLDARPEVGPGWALLGWGVPVAVPDADTMLVVSSRVDLSGRVLDTQGAPIADAKVELNSYRALRALPFVIDQLHLEQVFESAVTASDGSFRLDQVPGSSSLQLVAKAAGFVTRQLPCPERDSFDLRIELASTAPPVQRDDRPAVKVTGTVVNSAGEPVSDAAVCWWGMGFGAAPRTGELGDFALELTGPPEPDALLAARAEGLGLVVEPQAAALILESWPEAPAPFLLRFPAEPLAIRGRLTSSEGEPTSGWTVKLLGGTVVTPGFLSSDSALEGEVSATTDDQGRFALVGLDQRPYDLVAFENSSGAVDRLENVEPSSRELEWILPEGANLADLHGVVVTTDGAPLEGATITVNSVTTWIQTGGSSMASFFEAGSSTTDAQGRFTLEQVPQQFAKLGVVAPVGTRVEPPQLDLDEVDFSEELRIEVPFLRPVAIEVTDGSGADVGGRVLMIEVHDSWGEALQLRTFTANGSSGMTRMSWAGRSYSHVWTSELAVEVVLLELIDGAFEEVDRSPVVFGSDGMAKVLLTAP